MKVAKQIEEEPRFRQNKKFLFWILPLFHLLLFVWALYMQYSLVDYNIDNYRYVYSALLQVVGSIFAFVASSTLVVLQLLHSNAPNAARLYPKSVFSSFLIVSIIVLVCDTVAILFLCPSITWLNQIILDFLISINLYPVLLAFLYVFYVIQYITPKSQIAHILQESKRAKNNDDRRCIIFSLEEMILTSIKAGHGGNVKLYTDAFSDIISIFTNTRPELNACSNHEPSNPLRLIPDVIERIVAGLIDNDMNNLMHYYGHILRQLSGSKYDNHAIVGVEIATAIENITEKCLEASCATDLTNFSANFIMCADEESEIGTIFWGTRFLIDTLKKSASSDVPYIFSHVVSDLHYLLDNVTQLDIVELERMITSIERQDNLIQMCSKNGSNNLEKELREMRKFLDTKQGYHV